MTNYGIKFNEKDHDPMELKRMTYKTSEQIKAEATLRFIEKGRPTTKNAPDIFALTVLADARAEVPGGRFPWEPRTPSLYHEDVPPKPRWLAELLGEVRTPWWRRLWRWVDPRKQFRDWDRDEEAWTARYGDVPFLHPSPWTHPNYIKAHLYKPPLGEWHD